jgi:hypothetical protein
VVGAEKIDQSTRCVFESDLGRRRSTQPVDGSVLKTKKGKACRIARVGCTVVGFRMEGGVGGGGWRGLDG